MTSAARQKAKHAASRQADADAAALKLEVGRCEKCGCRILDRLQVHEIARGNGLRHKARGKAFASLVLCDGFANGCHNSMDGMPLARQLAYLYLSRQSDLRLDLFYQLTSRRFPDLADVMMEVKQLIQKDKPMKTYLVRLPVAGCAEVEVEAETANEAVEAAFASVTLEHLQEWEAHRKIVEGNVFHGNCNRVEVDVIEDDS